MSKMALRAVLTLMILTAVTTAQSMKTFDVAIRDAFYSVLRQPFVETMTMNKGSAPPDEGVVNSCGPPDANFTVTWSPKIINPEGRILVKYDYKIPHDFSKGTAYVALYFNDIPNPIFEDTFPIGCDKIGKYLPCPLKAGIHLHGKYSYQNLLILKGYDGTYRGIVKLKTDKNKIMFCANATVTIKGRG